MAADLPKTFKATVFQKPLEPLTIEDVELKQPIEGEVLIKGLDITRRQSKAPD